MPQLPILKVRTALQFLRVHGWQMFREQDEVEPLLDASLGVDDFD